MTASQFMLMLEGTVTTLELTVISIALGLVLAFIITFMRIGKIKILKAIAWFYTWVFRGTPLLLQIMITYFGVPLIAKQVFGATVNPTQFTAAVIALMLNTAAYIAEILRAAIESIDKGQMEAAKALGMTYSQAMSKIIVPQIFKRILPPFANEFIMILKDTSLVTTIGMVELMMISRQFAATGDWKFYFYAGGIYLMLTSLFVILFGKLEKYAGRYE